MVADSASDGRFRLRVTFARRKNPTTSRVIDVRYWHWTPISKFTAYQTSGSAYGGGYVPIPMGGRTWNGWYSSGGETRHTLGRNCKEAKGTVGLEDNSKDGSSGRVTLSTIDESNNLTPVYQSPTVGPGALTPFDVLLASPYRISIIGTTSTAPISPGSSVMVANATVAIGDLQFLCHFSS